MNSGFAVAYRLGITPWERKALASAGSFDTLMQREEQERTRPYGRVLDIGCGTGGNTRRLRARGWEAVGVDFVRQAVDIAMRRGDSEGSRLVIGDARYLVHCGVGDGFSLFLDVGCFHGLSGEDRALLGAGVTRLATDDATLLLLARHPGRFRFPPRGASADDVRRAFPAWTLLSEEPAVTEGMPRLARLGGPTWYRLRRTADAV